MSKGLAKIGRVVTTAGVGVGIGGPQAPQAGSTDRDRRTMELELSEKGLPEGEASVPVPGYLYFALPSGKDRKAAHQLEYTFNGNKVALKLQ